tara:strand:+ start:866 stop:1957 length:1092 start_codon:yes stop_codon:yes gene_type:complete
MAFISFKPNLHFNTILYTGNGTAIGSGGQAITGVGFSANLTWLKERSSTSGHHLIDTARGATKKLSSDSTAVESTNSETIASWQSDGFTVGDAGGVNENSQTYVAWNWKMGTTSGLSGGTITPSAYTINTTTKCGAYAYTGNGTLGATIPHGLGVKPAFVIIKPRDLTDLWAVGHQHINMAGDKYLRLNEVNGVYSAGALFNSTNINDSTTVIKVGDNAATNQNTKLYIMYVFAETNGFSRFGQYQGTGSATVTPSIFCGFKPSMLMIKQSDGSGDWYIFDNKRETLQGDANSKSINPNDNNIRGNKNEAETTSGNFDIDLISTGFTVRCTNTEINGSGGHYIYAAFAEYPFIGSNSNPGKGG